MRDEVKKEEPLFSAMPTNGEIRKHLTMAALQDYIKDFYEKARGYEPTLLIWREAD